MGLGFRFASPQSRPNQHSSADERGSEQSPTPAWQVSDFQEGQP
jgi:hypothetical protein